MTRARPDVRLRPLRAADAVTIAGWAADPEFRRAADWGSERTVADLEQFHARLIAEPPASLLRLGVEHEGVLVGYVDLHGEEPGRRELGFVIGGRERWGDGLGRAAASAALDLAFDVLGLTEVTAQADPDNHRSVAVLRRLGLTETAATDGRLSFRLVAEARPRGEA
ncbi:GNAT family protein [Nocardioides marinquilinus]|uniref:GNAT family protein n=1 Tax=Nocardioides marinquilinus TaxID=1210400 RepID=A0ABP9PSZ7_9ACTN